MVMPSISEKGSPSMIMRSAKVPVSPSSALTHDIFLSPAGQSATVFHLMPVGKPAPPRPRRPEAAISATVASGPICECPVKPLVAAMRGIFGEGHRIDDAATLEGHAALAREIGMLLDLADAQGVRAARRGTRRRTARRRRRASPGRSRRGPAASRPRPKARARACRASRCERSRH